MRLELHDVSVRLGGSAIVDGIDLEVPAGGWLAVIGPNGAGKTTLLSAIAGSVPFSGRILIDGVDLRDRSRRDLAGTVALVPQRPTVPDGMRVVDYVLLGRTPHAGPLVGWSRHDRAVVTDTLERLALTDLAHRDVATLSGGELRRATIARALAQEAPVLLLDEPTTGLDVGRQQEVMELVDSLRSTRDVAVVSALHDLTLAGQFADRLLLLAGGRAVAEGDAGTVLTPETIRAHYDAGVRVLDDGDGGIVVIPVRGDDTRRSAQPSTVAPKARPTR